MSRLVVPTPEKQENLDVIGMRAALTKMFKKRDAHDAHGVHDAHDAHDAPHGFVENVKAKLNGALDRVGAEKYDPHRKWVRRGIYGVMASIGAWQGAQHFSLDTSATPDQSPNQLAERARNSARGHIPRAGQAFDAQRFAPFVVDADGKRIIVQPESLVELRQKMPSLARALAADGQMIGAEMKIDTSLLPKNVKIPEMMREVGNISELAKATSSVTASSGETVYPRSAELDEQARSDKWVNALLAAIAGGATWGMDKLIARRRKQKKLDEDIESGDVRLQQSDGVPPIETHGHSWQSLLAVPQGQLARHEEAVMHRLPRAGNEAIAALGEKLGLGKHPHGLVKNIEVRGGTLKTLMLDAKPAMEHAAHHLHDDHEGKTLTSKAWGVANGATNFVLGRWGSIPGIGKVDATIKTVINATNIIPFFPTKLTHAAYWLAKMTPLWLTAGAGASVAPLAVPLGAFLGTAPLGGLVVGGGLLGLKIWNWLRPQLNGSSQEKIEGLLKELNEHPDTFAERLLPSLAMADVEALQLGDGMSVPLDRAPSVRTVFVKGKGWVWLPAVGEAGLTLKGGVLEGASDDGVKRGVLGTVSSPALWCEFFDALGNDFPAAALPLDGPMSSRTFTAPIASEVASLTLPPEITTAGKGLNISNATKLFAPKLRAVKGSLQLNYAVVSNPPFEKNLVHTDGVFEISDVSSLEQAPSPENLAKCGCGSLDKVTLQLADGTKYENMQMKHDGEKRILTDGSTMMTWERGAWVIQKKEDGAAVVGTEEKKADALTTAKKAATDKAKEIATQCTTLERNARALDREIGEVNDSATRLKALGSALSASIRQHRLTITTQLATHPSNTRLITGLNAQSEALNTIATNVITLAQKITKVTGRTTVGELTEKADEKKAVITRTVEVMRPHETALKEVARDSKAADEIDKKVKTAEKEAIVPTEADTAQTLKDIIAHLDGNEALEQAAAEQQAELDSIGASIQMVIAQATAQKGNDRGNGRRR